MKRFLLFAAAAVIAVSASAQTLGKKGLANKSHRQTQKVSLKATKLSKADYVAPASTFGGKLTESQFGIDKKLDKKAAGYYDMRAHKGTFKAASSSASNRAGSVQAAYDAYGTSALQSVKWSIFYLYLVHRVEQTAQHKFDKFQ